MTLALDRGPVCCAQIAGMTPTERFLRARDLLLRHREDHEAACASFAWPELPQFNWALDYFDVVARGEPRPALRMVDDVGEEARSFAELADISSRIASALQRRGVARGDRVLLLLPTTIELWELKLALIKLGAVIVPVTVQLTVSDLRDRITRGHVRHVICDFVGCDRFAEIAGNYTRIVIGGVRIPGWISYDELRNGPAGFVPDAPTNGDDLLLLYFTSGTTARPRPVAHSHTSYPVGHLSTMYWLGLRADDVHENISSPGWAKHAWSSFFAPWNAGATVLMHDYPRFSAEDALRVIRNYEVSSLCAPPTVWRMLMQVDMGPRPPALRSLACAGEPLSAETFEQVQRAWGLPLRDGYGQTETTAMVGNSPGLPIRPGSMGRPLPGYEVVLLDPNGVERAGGEVSLRMSPRPGGLMLGYLDDAPRDEDAGAGAYYRTGDEAIRDVDGYIHFVGRSDDLFKCSDYRISPFELESVLIEHPAVGEVAVVPSPDEVRLAVPKAYVAPAPGIEPSAGLARSILEYARGQLAPYKRVRRLEFAELPRTASGKIRRVELRRAEEARDGVRSPGEYRLEDFG